MSIFVGAEPEDRYCFPNKSFLMQQPSHEICESASELEIHVEQIRHMRSWFDYLCLQANGQTIAWIRVDTQLDFWLNTMRVQNYGLIGQEIASTSELS